ncbi:unnamed protein product [Didymodactylos carnosus]|uniref:Cystatin domain-containing protein n=1 Tax=Didymodactylos carnosus TaxID=1234261 RepID=A0A814M4S8_9BILA|nr:unnamed protein product [Didymodactylos carnosus]CAF1466189.1 unnamed protein product [Didymodactylos carnosus]CAF3840612.1 unnamed protein product [Didymodactylos carnosus]CAF4258754.1 unnamed protein product [Didymodactylos carnosus]
MIRPITVIVVIFVIFCYGEHLLGGYTTYSESDRDYEQVKNEIKDLATKSLAEGEDSSSSRIEVTSISKQIVNGMNYRATIQQSSSSKNEDDAKSFTCQFYQSRPELLDDGTIKTQPLQFKECQPVEQADSGESNNNSDESDVSEEQLDSSNENYGGDFY